MLANDRNIHPKNINIFIDKTPEQLNRFLTHCIPIVKQSEKDAKKLERDSDTYPIIIRNPKYLRNQTEHNINHDKNIHTQKYIIHTIG